MSHQDLHHTRQTHSTFTATLDTLLRSTSIFLRNKRIFLSIFALTTFPLSFLLFSLSFSTRSLRFQIHHLEAVAVFASTHLESLFLRLDSRINAVSLLRIKALFFLPCYALSLLAAVTSVSSTSLAYGGKRPSFVTALNAVRLTWKRPLVTSICVYVLLLAYAPIPRVLAAVLSGSPAVEIPVVVIGLGVEVYLMAVMSVGMVVSIAEERCGWEAIRVGWGLMAGRRVSGWVLSGGFLLVATGIIRSGGNGMEEEVEGDYWWSVVGKEMGLMGMYGMVVMWSYVVATVFYCDCRTCHGFPTTHHHPSHMEVIMV
ncbi:hypothetical protein FEM48_Zijuj01G0120400 [Ziziphus jujuba var. spinosa]|uniref:Transmembrane protein n=1 Tax=Ziziphus jujuba var. spinosa TaxID=714518 RepID=A0A978W154_ZIZJJ|nr:hypothetical protein FEM48_Zijuj01G0120400 [Ziziphus jujuba var. spinosa]